MSISAFSLGYQKSPIIFQGGIASEPGYPGGLMPIISITQSAAFTLGPSNAATATNEFEFVNASPVVTSSNLELQSFFFDFHPAAGGKLIEQQAATYPFANRSVAANSTIAEPLSISLIMEAPTRANFNYAQRLATFQALQAALSQHNRLGGTFIVATPSYIYTDCLLLSLRDISEGDPKYPQSRWQWEFFQPLLTLESAQAAQNSLMQQLNSAVKVTPNGSGQISYSGLSPTVANPQSGQAPATTPAARPLPGAAVSGAPSLRIPVGGP